MLVIVTTYHLRHTAFLGYLLIMLELGTRLSFVKKCTGVGLELLNRIRDLDTHLVLRIDNQDFQLSGKSKLTPAILQVFYAAVGVAWRGDGSEARVG